MLVCQSFCTFADSPQMQMPVNMCEPVDFTFSIFKEVVMSWDIKNYHPDCEFTINISSCTLEFDPCIINDVRDGVSVSLDKCLTPNQHVDGVIVEVRYTECLGSDNSCKSPLLHLPGPLDNTG